MDLEIVIIREVRELQIFYAITYMQDIKYATNELINETEKKITEQVITEVEQNKSVLYGEQRKDKLGGWD